MHNTFKEYTTQKGETIVYIGTPHLSTLETLADGPGDIWHSSPDQGYTNAFGFLVYFTATFWRYLKCKYSKAFIRQPAEGMDGEGTSNANGTSHRFIECICLEELV